MRLQNLGIGTTSVGSGLKARGDYYANDAYGKTSMTLRIKGTSGVGEARLSLHLELIECTYFARLLKAAWATE